MKGYTLIELLLVVGLIGILALFSVPIGINFYRSQLAEGSRTELIELLTRARRYAVLQKSDARYGVKIETSGGEISSFILYQGVDYDSRNDTLDETYSQVPNLEISYSGSADLSLGEINFSKLAGTTTATGTITISHTYGGSRAVFIDDFGNAYATSTSN